MPGRDESCSSDDSDEGREARHPIYDVLTWEETALEEQQHYYTMFGDRDYNSFKPCERLFLVRQVGFALFGLPPSVATAENMYTGYSDSQLATLKDVVKTIEDCQGSSHETLLATIFVSLKMDTMPMISVPVFRIPKFDGVYITDEMLFIDISCRVYNGWNDYLLGNMLPPCKCCYPCCGIYSGDAWDHVMVEFGYTPAAQTSGRMLSCLDTASNVAALTAASITIASLAVPVKNRFLVVASVSAVTAGLYGIGRSIGVLKDRYRHRQNIGLMDAESRTSWLSMVGGVLGVWSGTAMRVISFHARKGVAISAGRTAAVTTLNVASLVANGTGLLNNLFTLIERRATGELTKLEVFQFSMSVFFFTHSILNFQTASEVIKESQLSGVSDLKKTLSNNRHRRDFWKSRKQSAIGTGSDERNSRVIKRLQSFDHKDSFFARFARNMKGCSAQRAKLTLTENGQIQINDQPTNHSVKFNAMSRFHRKFVLDSSNILPRGDLTRTTFRNNANPIVKQYKVHFSNARAETRVDLCRAFGVHSLNNIVIGGKRIFKDVKDIDVDLLSSMLQCFEFNDMLELTKTVADKLGCSDIKEFIDIEHFLIKQISELLSEMETSYQNSLNDVQIDDTNFNKDPFDEIYGIVGDRVEYFLKVIFSMFKLPHNLNNLLEDYSHFKDSDNLAANESGFFLFGAYYKFRDFSSNGNMSEEEILSTASEVLGIPVDSVNSEVVHEEDMIAVFRFGENAPTRTVMIETNEKEGSITAREL